MVGQVDYFISYTSADKSWAEWIGWVLEETGATVRLQAWDFVPGSNFVLEMQRAAREAKRTIAVLSPDYLKSRFAAPEWASAFAQDPEGMARRFVPVCVRECALEGMLQTIVHIDLVGLNEIAARKALSDGLGSKRSKPDRAPTYPGPISDEPLAHDPMVFPGAKQQPWTMPSSSRRPSSYLPKARRPISDLEHRRLVKGAFETIKQHFEASLQAFTAEPGIDTELTHRGDTEFVAEVFVQGERKARCRIWLGGMLGGSNEISYYEGEHDMGNAVNESLSIAHEQQDGLALNAMMSMGFGMKGLPSEIDPHRMSPEQAAEYLWHRFLWRLE